jgi:hypothetical protein
MTMIIGCYDTHQRRVLSVAAGWYKAITRHPERRPL